MSRRADKRPLGSNESSNESPRLRSPRPTISAPAVTTRSPVTAFAAPLFRVPDYYRVTEEALALRPVFTD
jgi:hypothetical protein